MKSRLSATLIASLALASIAHAGDTSVKCTAEAKDIEERPITITAVKFYFGPTLETMTRTVSAKAPDCSTKFSDLAAGDWFFLARSVTKDGEGNPSEIVKRTIPKAPAKAPVIQ
jgi:hypothetical protein